MKKILVGTLALAAIVAVPGISMAADYAYVNASGEVNMVTAADANTAIMTAPNIHMRSGVMLLTASDSGIVGDDVNGI